MSDSMPFRGINGFQLKTLALISMTADHIYLILGRFLAVPALFNLFGRLSAPIFIFILCEGLRHTKNRRIYIFRLYVFSVITEFLMIVISALAPVMGGFHINIFSTLFLIALLADSTDKIVTGSVSADPKRTLQGFLGIIMPFVLQGIFSYSGGIWTSIVRIFFPLPFMTEGGIYFVGLGLALYFCGKQKKAAAVFYSLFSLMFLLPSMVSAFGGRQWAMVFALPFMLLYNGERGRGLKYFFYLYYPLHIVLLSAAACCISLMPR